MRRRNGLSAWLVTWEWSGDHAKPKKKIAEILDPRMSPERVREIVELLYHEEALLSEKIAWRLRRREQPYPAEFATIDGVRWMGQILSGHNPWLEARLVDNLMIEIDADQNEIASWTDRCSVSEMREKLHRIRNGW
jgi:hypothetical protein